MARYSTMASDALLNVEMRLMTLLATASNTRTRRTAATHGRPVRTIVPHSSPPAATATITYSVACRGNDVRRRTSWFT